MYFSHLEWRISFFFYLSIFLSFFLSFYDSLLWWECIHSSLLHLSNLVPLPNFSLNSIALLLNNVWNKIGLDQFQGLIKVYFLYGLMVYVKVVKSVKLTFQIRHLSLLTFMKGFNNLLKLKVFFVVGCYSLTTEY